MTETVDALLEDTQRGRYLTFLLESGIFAMEIKYIREIIGLQPVTPLPETQEYVRGIINLRGQIVPVIDMRLKLGREAAEYNERTCIIVIQFHEDWIGLIVDRVLEVVGLDDEAISPPPMTSAGRKSRYLKGIGKLQNEIKLILDCDQILSDEEYGSIADAQTI